MSVTIEERFHFDLSGFLILRNILTQTECEAYLNILSKLEQQDYEDLWLKKKGLVARQKKPIGHIKSAIKKP